MTITLKEFDRLLAEYCAPTLKGIKAANIVRLNKKGGSQDLQKILEEYNFILNTYDIYLAIVDEDEESAAILVYNKKLVAEGLNHPKTKEALHSLDLNIDMTVDSIVTVARQLKQKGARLTEAFKEYLGCSKEKQAEYDACTQEVLKEMEQGVSLISIIRQDH